jgi:hypothetical protein
MPDGTVHEDCVPLPEGRVTGMDLLAAAGFEVIAEVNALGSTVCAIDGSGCRYPSEPCWCECRSLGDECTYWAYHVSDGAEWLYSTVGALARVVEDGDVDGWAWGPGQEGSGAEPPFRRFDQVCRAAVFEGTPTESARDDDPVPTMEPDSPATNTAEHGRGARESGTVEAQSANEAASDSGLGSRDNSRISAALSAATVEALATALALAADDLRSGSGADAPAAGARKDIHRQRSESRAAGGESTPAAIALLEAASAGETGEPNENAAYADTGGGLAGYAAAGLLLCGLALVGGAIRRSR